MNQRRRLHSRTANARAPRYLRMSVAARWWRPRIRKRPKPVTEAQMLEAMERVWREVAKWPSARVLYYRVLPIEFYPLADA